MNQPESTETTGRSPNHDDRSTNEPFLYDRALRWAVQFAGDVELPGRCPLGKRDVDFVIEVAQLAAIVVEDEWGCLCLSPDEDLDALCQSVVDREGSCEDPDLVPYVALLVQDVLAALEADLRKTENAPAA